MIKLKKLLSILKLKIKYTSKTKNEFDDIYESLTPIDYLENKRLANWILNK